MAALTWRNVDAPDFRTALEGYRQSSQMLDSAFDTLGGTIREVDDGISQRVNNRLQLEILAADTPDKAKAVAAALQNDPQARRISGATLNAAASRPGALIEQATGELNLDKAKYGFNRDRQFDAAEDAAAPLLAGYVAASRTGKGAEYMAANPALAKLGYEKVNALLASGLNAEKSDVDIVAGRQNIEFDKDRHGWARDEQGRIKVKFGWEVDDRAAEEQADLVMSGIDRTSFDQDSALLTLRSLEGVNPKVYNAVRSRISSMFPALDVGAAAVPDSTGASLDGISGGGNFERVVNYEARGRTGISTVPADVQTLGQLVDWGKRINKIGKNDPSERSSATGLFQITQSTYEEFGEKALGKNWRNAALTAANQDKVAEQIFKSAAQDKTGRALKARWVSLTPAQAKQLAQSGDWSAARGLIAQKESGIDPSNLVLGDAIVQVGATTNRMERNAGNIASTYAKSAGDFRETPIIAGGLVAKDPSFKGESVGYVSSLIDDIVTRAAVKGKVITSAVARDMLTRSRKSTAWSRNMPSWLGGGDAQGFKVDGAAIDAQIKSYSSGAVEKAIIGDVNQTQRLQLQMVAQNKLMNLKGRLAQAVRASQQGVAVNPNIISQLTGQIAQLEAEVSALQSSNAINPQTGAAGNPAVTSFNAPPAVAAPKPIVRRRSAKASQTPTGALLSMSPWG